MYLRVTIGEVIRDYTGLFKRPQIPPRYAFGIWASANHWNSEADVDRLLEELEKYHFPASVIVLEAWSDEATFYIWNGATYSLKRSAEGFFPMMILILAIVNTGKTRNA